MHQFSTDAKDHLMISHRSLDDLWKTYSSTSTLHGMSFLGTSKSVSAKVLWLLIIVAGLILSSLGIHECLKGWEANPVITAVWQVPIESTPFPSITICPMGDER